MRIRVIDLDGSIPAQDRVLRTFRPEVYDLRQAAPRLRLACRWKRFHRFERRLDRMLGSCDNTAPAITFLGSGDFHHLSLALLRRMRHPFNLLVLDQQADWTGGSPLLHCGSWVRQAAQLSNVRRIFHAGGEAGFDDWRRHLAPKNMLRSGKIVAFPATRQFRNGFWSTLPHQPLRARPESLVDRDRLEELLWPYLDDLERWPLYVSLDKNVLWMPESVANWNSGVLDLAEIQEILQFFLKASGNDLLGMDVVGDWSPVFTRGVFAPLLHRMAHPRRNIDPEQARLSNERTNLMLLRFLSHDPVAENAPFPLRLKSAG
jgi:hypothetical protein